MRIPKHLKTAKSHMIATEILKVFGVEDDSAFNVSDLSTLWQSPVFYDRAQKKDRRKWRGRVMVKPPLWRTGGSEDPVSYQLISNREA